MVDLGPGRQLKELEWAGVPELHQETPVSILGIACYIEHCQKLSPANVPEIAPEHYGWVWVWILKKQTNLILFYQ